MRVAEKFLHAADVIAGFEEMCGETVAEGVATDRLGDARQLHGLPDRPLKDLFIEMMAAFFSGAGVLGDAGGREGPLPAPLAGGVQIFSFKGVGEVDFAEAISQIFFVKDFDAGEVFLESGFDGVREHGDAVFIPFAVANDDLVPIEIDVFDTKAERFHEAQPCAIEKFGKELMNAGEGGDDAADFIAGHDQREAGGAAGANQVVHPIQIDMQDLTVEENERIERLVLSGGGDILVDREIQVKRQPDSAV